MLMQISNEKRVGDGSNDSSARTLKPSMPKFGLKLIAATLFLLRPLARPADIDAAFSKALLVDIDLNCTEGDMVLAV